MHRTYNFLLLRYLKQLCLYFNGQHEDKFGKYKLPECWFRSDRLHKPHFSDCGGTTYFSGFILSPTHQSAEAKRYPYAEEFFRDVDSGRWTQKDLAIARTYVHTIFVLLIIPTNCLLYFPLILLYIKTWINQLIRRLLPAIGPEIFRYHFFNF